MFLLRRLKPGKHDNGRDNGRRLLDLEKELERTRMLNKQLQEQLAASGVMVGEYLYCFRTVALPMLGSEWELRYIVLSGQCLKQYKSAKDLVYNPREETAIMGCVVEWEGLVGQHWVFSIVDPNAGTTLLRLSALSKAVAQKWVDALYAAGCQAGRPASATGLGLGRSSSMELSRRKGLPAVRRARSRPV